MRIFRPALSLALIAMATLCASQTSYAQSGSPQSKVIAGNGRSAMDCAVLTTLTSSDSRLEGTGGRVIENHCGEQIEAVWCYMDGECQRGGSNAWTIAAGRSYPVSSKNEIRWAACRGANTADFEEGSQGLRYICMAPLGKEQPQTRPPASASADSPALAPQDTELAKVRSLAEGGNAQMQYALGTAYEQGTRVPRDMDQAREWYRRAAEGGLARAEIRYGIMLYQDGRYAEAAPFFEKTSGEGNAISQYMFAGMLWTGKGVPQDRVRARKLMALAAAQSLPKAKEALAQMDRVLTPPARSVPPQGIDVAARTRGGADPIWAACEGPIMAWLQSSNDTSPSTVQRIREAWSFPAMKKSWGSAPDSELQGYIDMWEQAIADAPRQYLNIQIREGFIISTHAQICEMNAYMNARRAGN